MRVVSWNMGCGLGQSYRATHDQGWRYLLDQLAPDIALVQEALLKVPDFVHEHGEFHVLPASEGWDWGSGIFTKGHTAAPRSLPGVTGVYAVALDVVLPVGGLVVASLHVRPTNDQHDHLRATIDTLLPALGRGDVIFGGDLNAARHWDKVHGGIAYTWFFEEVEKSCVNCHWDLHHEERQSFWGPQAKEAYQDDHVFVSRLLQPRVASCEIHDRPRVRELSDHGPVILDLRE